MSARAKLIFLLTLLPLISCLTGAEDALQFPTFKEGESSFPSIITIVPEFSGNGNYGLVAVGDTLYHLELNHARIHGKTPVSGTITAIDAGSQSTSFALFENKLVRIEGFDIAASAELPGNGMAMSLCGSNPVVLMQDGSLVLHDGNDLSVISNHTPLNQGITSIQGFPGLLATGYSDGTMVSFSLPSFTEIASEKLNEPPLFFRDAGPDNLIFSCASWNEVALASPADLKIQVMFTFPETPLSATADSAASCIYAVCPASGIYVCLENGEIAWRTSEFGSSPMVRLSEDCQTALVAWEDKVTLLLR